MGQFAPGKRKIKFLADVHSVCVGVASFKASGTWAMLSMISIEMHGKMAWYPRSISHSLDLKMHRSIGHIYTSAYQMVKILVAYKQHLHHCCPRNHHITSPKFH